MRPNDGSLRPQKTALLLAQRIVGDIVARDLVVGDRLPPERAMIEEYDVGRGTLRETLRFLELQGVIALKPGPGGGPVVQQPDASSLATSLTLLLQFADAPYRTIAEARMGLEPMMARLAAERMSDEDIAEVGRSVERMGESLPDEAVFLAENKRFHDVIGHGSGNAMFGYLIDALLDILDGSAVGIDYPEIWRPTVYRAHSAIYEALAARKPSEAADAMAEHVAGYMQYAERKFPEVLARRIAWGRS